MNRTRVKICGLTRREDVQTAVDAGADALGFVFYPASPRYVSAHKASELMAEMPPFVTSVGLFVNADIDDIAAVVETTDLSQCQSVFQGFASGYLDGRLRRSRKGFQLVSRIKRNRASGRFEWWLECAKCRWCSF